MLSKNTYYHLLILILGSVVILSNSIYSSNGFLSPDSTQYLSLAQNLLEGHGFTVSSQSLNGEAREYFAIWPLGYPLFIFITAKLFGVSVFIASKIVNIIFLALSLWMVSKIFTKHSPIFASVLLFGAYLQLFSHSFSEIPFIFGLLWFCFSINHYLDHSHSKTALLQLLIAGLFLFMMRYIGAFSFAVIALLALWQLKQKRFDQFVALSTITLLGLICISLYLYNNSLQTGWITGRERFPAFESNLQFIVMLTKAFIQEVVLLSGHDKDNFTSMLVLQFAVIGLIWLGFNRQKLVSTNTVTEHTMSLRHLSYIFLLVGLGYYLAIISSRYISHFDALNYRLLAPGTLLVIYGLLLKIQEMPSGLLYHRIRLIIMALAAISVVINIVTPYSSEKPAAELTSYQQNIQQINNEYSVIPDNAIVVFADNHLRYLRTSLIIARPDYMPLARRNESVEHLLQRLTSNYPDKKIYIETTQNKVSCQRLHSSWCGYLKQHSQQQFYQIQ